MRNFPTKTKVVDHRITERTPGNEERYNRLMSAYRVAEFSEGIKSLVIQIFKLTGVWGLTHNSWNDFCGKALHLSRSQADRMADEGAVARTILRDDPFVLAVVDQLETALENSDSSVSVKILVACPNWANQENNVLEHKNAPIARDRKLLRAVQAASPSNWEAVAEQATKNGDMTPRGIKKAIEELGASPKKETKADAMPDELKESPCEALRAALYAAEVQFHALRAMPDAKLTGAAGSVHEYCRKVSKEAKKL